MTPHKALLVPVKRITLHNGRFVWPQNVVLASPSSADLLPLGQLQSHLKRQIGVRARIERNAYGSYTLRVRRDSAIKHAQGYRIAISPVDITVFAGSDAGAYYGLQTLCELVRVHGRSLPTCEIVDEPDFRRGAVYLDCSRGKVPTVTTVKSLVEQLSRWKLNELQLYVENVFTFNQHPSIGKGFSPFSPQDLLEIQDHCRLHHVQFVPSLASFGHLERVLALPAYQHLGELGGHYGLPGGTTLCPGDSGSIKLMSEFFDEYLPLFETVEFNACCDETWELGKGRSKRRADRIGTGRVYLDFILKLHTLCQKHGKRMNIWSDIVLGHPELIPEVPKDIVMLNWDYSPKGYRISRSKEFVEAGLAFVACPGTSDWQSHGTRLQNAIDNVSVFAAEARKCGGEGMLNTEWGDAGHRNPLGVSMHGYAHGAAHAWNGSAVYDSTFTRTFAYHFFGQDSVQLASAITTLGSTEDRVGGTIPYHGLVSSLVEDKHLFRGIPAISPVWRPPAHRRDYIGEANLKGCRDTISKLQKISWEAFDVGTDCFVRESLRDLVLAASMDALACKRIVVGRRLRQGKSVASTEFKTLTSDTRKLTREFEANWLRRNRPSRLRDNLKLFENAERESRSFQT